ncbi:MAG: DoxX family protein [Robiginitomaculum sp.]|nr:DoxX family protein [Robiginitomaculum sp.]
MTKILRRFSSLLTFWYPYADKLKSLSLLAARLFVGRVFFKSGLAKWNGFLKFNPDTYDLFEYEFFCPDEIRKGALYLCDKAEGDYTNETMRFVIDRFANLAGIMEVALGLTLILGLYSRVAALGLLAMTLFIQFFVFTDAATWWGSHAWWFAALFVILGHGPGWFSIDKLMKIEK